MAIALIWLVQFWGVRLYEFATFRYSSTEKSLADALSTKDRKKWEPILQRSIESKDLREMKGVLAYCIKADYLDPIEMIFEGGVSPCALDQTRLIICTGWEGEARELVARHMRRDGCW